MGQEITILRKFPLTQVVRTNEIQGALARYNYRVVIMGEGGSSVRPTEWTTVFCDFFVFVGNLHVVLVHVNDEIRGSKEEAMFGHHYIEIGWATLTTLYQIDSVVVGFEDHPTRMVVDQAYIDSRLKNEFDVVRGL